MFHQGQINKKPSILPVDSYYFHHLYQEYHTQLASLVPLLKSNWLSLINVFTVYNCLYYIPFKLLLKRILYITILFYYNFIIIGYYFTFPFSPYFTNAKNAYFKFSFLSSHFLAFLFYSEYIHKQQIIFQ